MDVVIFHVEVAHNQKFAVFVLTDEFADCLDLFFQDSFSQGVSPTYGKMDEHYMRVNFGNISLNDAAATAHARESAGVDFESDGNLFAWHLGGDHRGDAFFGVRPAVAMTDMKTFVTELFECGSKFFFLPAAEDFREAEDVWINFFDYFEGAFDIAMFFHDLRLAEIVPKMNPQKSEETAVAGIHLIVGEDGELVFFRLSHFGRFLACYIS